LVKRPLEAGLCGRSPRRSRFSILIITFNHRCLLFLYWGTWLPDSISNTNPRDTFVKCPIILLLLQMSCVKEKSYLFGLTNRYSEYIISVSSEVIREDYQWQQSCFSMSPTLCK
jgi:hypothetical protein